MAVTACDGGRPRGGGSGASAVPPSGTPSAIVFSLFDVSGSTQGAIRERYLKDFKGILATLQGGEQVMGDLITSNSLATSSYPVQGSIPVYSVMGKNKMAYEKERSTTLKNLEEVARKLVLQPPTSSRGTDIINAMRAADKVFNGHGASADRKALIVFSDMIEQSNSYDFAVENLTTQRIQQIVDAEKKNGLPNLKGVTVWVAGATAATSGGIDGDKILDIQNFWVAYFSACGADLSGQRYAGTLINWSWP